MTTTEQLRPAVTSHTAEAAARVDSAEAPEAAARRSRTAWSLGIVLVALSPLVVGGVSIIRRGFPPGALFGDRAILGLTAGDAWRAPVLLGPYSRFYWHHPGPLYFYALNVLSTVFGGGTVGLVLGTVAINAAAVVGILVVALRRGGRPLLVWTALLVTAYLVAIDPIPYDVWNPSVTVIPFVLVLLLAWSVMCRDWWATPWLVLVASFAVQTHVGLVPGVAMAVAWTVGLTVWRWRRRDLVRDDGDRRSVRGALLASTAVAFVVWLPPVIEELTSREGNLTALAHFFTRPGSPHTLSEGLHTAGLQATLILRGVFAHVSLMADGQQGLTFALVVSALAFGLALLGARRARAADAQLLLALVAVELVVGVYGVTKIVGPIQYYVVQWISAVGFVLWFAVGAAGLEIARARGWSRSWSSAARRGVVAVVVVVLCVSAVRAFPGHAGIINENLDVPNNRALFGYVPARQLLAATRDGQTVVLRNDEPTAWEVLAADALLLEQHGRTVQIVESRETQLLFDDAVLVRAAPPGARVLSFRERSHAHPDGTDATLAHQGKWTIVAVHPGG